VNTLLEWTGVPLLARPGLILPLGISFFTFHAVSYLMDVYRGRVPAQRNPLDVALYIALFPQLIAGPIVRYATIAPQIARRRTTWDDLVWGIRRFVVGLGKKVLIANTLARPADAVFAVPPSELSAGLAWLGVACYALQIYFDFSGYSDMAIGLARIFGFPLPGELSLSHVSRSLTEFWRRWHISLSTWFRDYLYVPLGATGAVRRVYLNLVVVFVFCGLWHGASWTFLVWGYSRGLSRGRARHRRARRDGVVASARPRLRAGRHHDWMGAVPSVHARARGGHPPGDGRPPRRRSPALGVGHVRRRVRARVRGRRHWLDAGARAPRARGGAGRLRADGGAAPARPRGLPPARPGRLRHAPGRRDAQPSSTSGSEP
jgi:hypothetical protein